MTTSAFHLVLSLMFELFGHFFGDHFSLLIFFCFNPRNLECSHSPLCN